MASRRSCRHAVRVTGSVPFFDDLALLRLMLSLDEQGWLRNITGEQLMEQAGGMPGDEAQRPVFVRELHIAREDELIGFELGHILGRIEPPRDHEYAYVQNLRNFRLRSAGRDRARGRVILQPLPDPDEDDGRAIPLRVIERVADALGEPLRGEEVRSFLLDAGVPAERLPDMLGWFDPSSKEGASEATYVRATLVGVRDRGSAGRRVVRSVIGRWLADELELGPSAAQRAEITGALARIGWHLRGNLLVIGEPVRRSASVTAGEGSSALETVLSICRRFDDFARQLTRRYADRDAFTVSDEYDVQDLLHAVLLLHFDDVRRESPNPSYLGSSSRIDFLLPEVGIAIEVKLSRDPRPDRRVGDELAEDVTRYADAAANRGARVLVCFVYDRNGILENPRGLERDLAAATTERLRVVGIVT
jgi:hypothetical protein